MDKREGAGIYAWKTGEEINGEFKNDLPFSGNITLPGEGSFDFSLQWYLFLYKHYTSRLILSEIIDKGLSIEGLESAIDFVEVSASELFKVVKKNAHLSSELSQWYLIFLCIGFDLIEKLVNNLGAKLMLHF